jgi:hypothetical protein
MVAPFATMSALQSRRGEVEQRYSQLCHDLGDLIFSEDI